MSNATIIAEAFGEDASLYVILGVSSTATAAELRKAYYRSALTCHPDKVSGKEKEFQAISVAYEILKDPERRSEYDETGELADEDEANSSDFDMWRQYFDNVFGRLTTSDIDKFAEKYKCSDEEQQDVLKAYTQHQGNLKNMLEVVMLSSERDAQRWVEDYIKPAIEEGNVPDYSKTLEKTLKKCLQKIEMQKVKKPVASAQVVDDDATESEESDTEPAPKKKAKKVPPKKKAPAAKTKRKSKAEREAEEAEALMAKIRGRNSVAKRKGASANFFSGLASKYGGVPDDPIGDDAEFERIQNNILKKGKKQKRT